MKKQISAAMMIFAMLAAPAMAQDMQQQAFETQVFHTEAGKPMQLAELSAQEMKETEGSAIWFAPAILAVTGGGAIGAWGNHAYSYAKTGQPASVNSTLKATGAGMATGASLYGAGRVVAPHTGTIGHWVRLHNSHSRTLNTPTKSLTWGSNKHHRQFIGNERMRNMNATLRDTKLPGSSWRVQDKGHFHLWKRK